MEYKLSDLKPCAICRGKTNPVFFRVQYETIVINQGHLKQVMGLMNTFGGGGGSLALAEIMGPVGHVAETMPGSEGEAIICVNCFAEEPMGMLPTQDEIADEDEDD